ncbi:MAG: orotidine-5'-phosphate decarboxylase [Candidatus Rokuibacteriota bacterium]|nr:MAG: orotidine-5'-phosphate decarboxylase [Candidatus Rokubacteria bacterium]PYO08164.1 MAG: orotidine-5'-phosphate decarboxylase [Candidatus Rokubacteria bacterium]
MTSASPADRILIALDVPSLDAADSLLGRLDGTLTGCKIGSQLFTAAGPAAIETARKRGFRVFLDLKFHDIPNTVGLAVREATRLGVFMLNIHASGGLAMACAAADAATKAAGDFAIPRPLCLGVTVLTSLDRRALQREVGVPTSVESHVLHLAALAREAGLDGCVASPQEISPLRLAMGPRWVIVTPGIRWEKAAETPGASRPDDQVRVATPRRALAAGADYLVVGRPISAASDPAKAAAAIVAELSAP